MKSSSEWQIIDCLFFGFAMRLALTLSPIWRCAVTALTITSIFNPEPVSAGPRAPSPLLTPVTFEYASEDLGYNLDAEIWNYRDEFLRGINNNLKFLRSSRAESAYVDTAPFREVAPEDISRERITQSLEKFREVLITSESSLELRERLRSEFLLYRSSGGDGKGSVRFTGYFQPTYTASRVKTAEYKYPIYQMPPQFSSWRKPHPSRVALEGYQGVGNDRSPLKGYEIAWFKSRFDAFMVHVQGSAVLQFPDGTQTAVGFAAGTDYPFTGISKEFLRSKKIAWGNLKSYFDRHPYDLDAILARNNRYILFKESQNPLPIGSLGVPVMPGFSIATDKKLLPPGALGIINTRIPKRLESGELALVRTTRLVLDQDTGSAIKGPGRVDIFMGTGPEAQERASSVYSDGSLYYLVLKNSPRWNY